MNPWGSNPSSKRRDRLYIIAEILEIAREGTLKTQVMYRANLSFTQLNDYLGFMLKISLLNKVSENGKDIYRATMKGMDFLQRYHEIVELLKTEENNGRNNNIKIPPPHLLRRN
ncbi:winged helix-turn-helix domain-containing protein [Candidatus Bathyarchaeota archaeon]|jgi:predicted transcriptional regulator|nr:winged helix-turn-helix domain-containing protein [Candidatus Bathyarchaeota archaeon]